VRGHENPGFQKQLTPETLTKVARLQAYAADHGQSAVALAIAWLLAQPQVCSVISGATAPAQVDENATGAEWSLTPSQVAEIEAIVAG
jgi:aryl-alcohol dehydrogenase-like predicted oxidoreductase